MKKMFDVVIKNFKYRYLHSKCKNIKITHEDLYYTFWNIIVLLLSYLYIKNNTKVHYIECSRLIRTLYIISSIFQTILNYFFS